MTGKAGRALNTFIRNFCESGTMKWFKAILVGLVAILSHKLAWEIALEGVSKNPVKSESKMKAASALSKFCSRRQRRNVWLPGKSNKQFTFTYCDYKRIKEKTFI